MCWEKTSDCGCYSVMYILSAGYYLFCLSYLDIWKKVSYIISNIYLKQVTSVLPIYILAKF